MNFFCVYHVDVRHCLNSVYIKDTNTQDSIKEHVLRGVRDVRVANGSM